MTTATQSVTTSEPSPRRSSFARVPAAFRLQYAVPWSFIWLPLIIFVLSWAFGYGVLALIDSQMPDRVPSAQEPLQATGAAQAPIWYLAFMAAYTASHTFPFSVALSYSRRVYLIGTYLAFLVTSVGYGVAAMSAYWIERATDGFGRHMYIFGIQGLENIGGMLGLGAVASVIVLFFMCFGFFWAILYRRVSIPILWTVIIGVIAVLLGSVALITRSGGWATIGRWFVEQTTFSMAAWGPLVTVSLGLLNYLLIRRATVSS